MEQEIEVFDLPALTFEGRPLSFVAGCYFELYDPFVGIECGTDEVDVEAAFDVPHGDAEDGAEIGDDGAERFGGGIVVGERGVEERVEAMGEVAGGVGGMGEGDEIVEGEEIRIFGVFGVGPGTGFHVGDYGFLGLSGEGEEEEKRKDNAEAQRTLSCAEKR